MELMQHTEAAVDAPQRALNERRMKEKDVKVREGGRWAASWKR